MNRGRTNLIEELGRVEAESSNRNRRDEIGRIHSELNKGYKKGGSVKKQGYKDRKDESIAMRIRKKRTKKQLRASANESYGRWGSKAKKSGKINR